MAQLHNIKLQKLSFDSIPVFVAKDGRSCVFALNKLLSFRPSFVGFDMEWKPNKKNRKYDNPTALIRAGCLLFIKSGFKIINLRE